MPKKNLPRIAGVSTAKAPWTLILQWVEGHVSVVDVDGHIGAFRIYRPLRENVDLFAHVRVGEYGASVAWTDDIDISADTLWRLGQEQAGVTMSAAGFRQWRERSNFTLDTAAAALGISRRMVAYYEKAKSRFQGLSLWRRRRSKRLEPYYYRFVGSDSSQQVCIDGFGPSASSNFSLPTNVISPALLLKLARKNSLP